MAKYTIDLLTNEKKYSMFSKKSRDRTVKYFDKNIIVPKYEEYYAKILE